MRADRAADLIVSSFTAVLEFSSKLLGPLTMGSLGANVILPVSVKQSSSVAVETLMRAGDI